MSWDDWSFGSDYGGDYGYSDGGYGDYGNNYASTPYDDYSYSYGSYDPGAYAFDTEAPSPLAGIAGGVGMGGYTDPETGQVYGGGSGGMSSGLGAPGAQGLFGGGTMGGLNTLQGILGLGGGLAGLIGTLAGGGNGGAINPVLGTAQKAQINQANQALQPGAMGQLPLQQQQAGMLQALAQGQIPPQMAQLVANAYDPMYQDAATRSVNAARTAGFHDNPLSSPVGGAIMGPAAAQLQGQQANTLLGLLQTFPQLFNAPIGNQIGAAQGQSNNLLTAANLGRGQQSSVPLGPQIGAQVGGMLQGASQAIGQNDLMAQLQRMTQGQGGVGTGNFYGG